MDNSSLLVGSAEFLDAIEPAILDARERVLIQVMTFEMDSVGRRFWELLSRSQAREKVLCVDAFSTAKISDDLVFGKRFLTDPAFRQEVRQTRRLLTRRELDGVRIAVTNPLGPLWLRYPFRNHKKIMIVDDLAFLGGINLSEHNFTWSDLMISTDCTALVAKLVADFRDTISGINNSWVEHSPLGELYLLDGRNSRAEYTRIFDRITAARRSLDIMSPYLSDPLLRKITRLPPSVQVRVVTPIANNKSLLQQTLLRAAARSKVEVLFYQPAMSHVKAILIDGRELIMGSSNFDFVGYDLQQEVVLCTRESALVGEFHARVLGPALAASVPCRSAPARWYHRGGVLMALSRWYVSLLGLTRCWGTLTR